MRLDPLQPSPGPIGDRRAVVGRRAKLVLRRWSFRMGLYVAQAEHHERFAGLVFGGEPDLVAGKLQDDVVHRTAGWKSQRAPIDGDRPAADAEDPPKSMTAARTSPVRFTITSTTRPMSSLAAL